MHLVICVCLSAPPSTVTSLHTGVDPAGQREAAQPGHGFQRHLDNSERPARGCRRLRLHGLQHVCHGRGQCHPLRARFVILGTAFHYPSPPAYPTSSGSCSFPPLKLESPSGLQWCMLLCFTAFLIMHCEHSALG